MLFSAHHSPLNTRHKKYTNKEGWNNKFVEINNFLSFYLISSIYPHQHHGIHPSFYLFSISFQILNLNSFQILNQQNKYNKLKKKEKKEHQALQLMKIWVIERRKDHSVPMSSSLTAFSPFPSSISPFLLTSRWHQSTRDLHQRQLQLCGLERKVKLSLSRIKKHRTHYLIIFAPFTCRCNEARTLFGSD